MEVAERINNETASLRHKLEAAVNKVRLTCGRLEERTSAAAKATDRAVREHPYHALGIVLGLGVLIGVLAARSWRD
jgi:ElaB/YqjD/DUF883 family membrane-anchored ribosome-binding protein